MSKSLDVWEEELSSKNKATARIYRKSMQIFLDYTGWDHEALFNTHREAIRSEDPRDWHKVSRSLKACMKEHIEKRGYSTSHAYQIQKAVTSFLNANGLNFKMNGSKPFSLEYMGQNVIDADGIRGLLEATAEPRTRALIMVAKDSGLRVSDIVKLDVGDVRRALDGGEDFVLIDLRQKKGGRAAKPILGPEALEALRKWLKTRPKGYADDSPLFTKIEGEGKYGERLNSDTASNVVLRLARKVGLKKISIHSLRKYHTTFCTLGKIPETWVAIIQGRKIRDSRDAYMKPTDSMLIKAYADAYDNLRVVKAEDVERQKMQKRIGELEGQLRTVDSTIKSLGRQFLLIADASKIPDYKRHWIEYDALEGVKTAGIDLDAENAKRREELNEWARSEGFSSYSEFEQLLKEGKVRLIPGKRRPTQQ